MHAGVHDYIMKDNLARMVPVIKRELREAEIRRARSRAEQALHHMAYHDALTNLINRTLFRDRLDHALIRSRRSGFKVALLFVDLDRFKVTNDTLGHDIGDILLKEVAKRLLKCARQEDTVARFGGDEFTVIVEGVTEDDDASAVAKNIIDALTQPFNLAGNEVFVSSSVGIALDDKRRIDAETLIRHADIAMHRAKEKGRNRYQFYEPEMNAKARVQMDLENSLHHALERHEMELYYQPQVDVSSGKICGAEALLRWNHSTLGMIPPIEFIFLLEETGLIIPVGEWVLRTACEQWKLWRDQGLLTETASISVNISSYQFKVADFAAVVESVLQDTQLPPCCLDLEITEGTLMEDTEASTVTLNRLKQMGVSISIDDFGTGYSSLSYLKKFPLDYLKIDKSFVQDIVVDPDDAAIATAIIGLSHNLRLQVVAEGVEDEQVLQFLKQKHCDYYQGYYFSKPVPTAEFSKILRS